MFGRKGLNGAPAPRAASAAAPAQAPRQPVDSVEHARAAGHFFFQTLYEKLASSGEAVSPHLLIAVLAAAGGVASIDSALRELPRIQRQTDNPNLLLEQVVGGQRFYVGDLPNHYLLENNHAVLCLALNAAIAAGAAVGIELAHNAMTHTMETVGTAGFAVPLLPQDHTPPARPLALAGIGWPQAVAAFDLVDLAPDARPAALGFALEKAITVTASVLDPGMAARIAVEYAVPMAAVDPRQFTMIEG